jgi:2-oxoglutarate dehydrogenase E1 component
VNGEAPEAVQRVGGMALDFRTRFETDVVVDLIGYRRYGHSEVDDPTATQPLLYRQIEARPMLWQSHARELGVPTPNCNRSRSASVPSSRRTGKGPRHPEEAGAAQAAALVGWLRGRPLVASLRGGNAG